MVCRINPKNGYFTTLDCRLSALSWHSSLAWKDAIARYRLPLTYVRIIWFPLVTYSCTIPQSHLEKQASDLILKPLLPINPSLEKSRFL